MTYKIRESQPVYGAHEWANESVNILSGCKHDCKYCYSKEMAIRFKRKTPETWKEEEIQEHVLKRKIRDNIGTIMFPSTHDITPKNLGQCIYMIQKILSTNNRILIVSKPHLECIKKICLATKQNKDDILFRFSIGSADSSVLKFWEPGAPSFEERLSALEYAYDHGFPTSVSCEPMLDEKIDDVIFRIREYVTDAIWIGKMNFVFRRLKTNGVTDDETMEAARKLHEWQNDDENILALYKKYENDTMIKWKESIKKVIGIAIPTQRGLDI